MIRLRGKPIAVGFYLLVPGLLIFDWALFKYLLGMDYITWYVANGAFIALSTAFLSRIWESIEDLAKPLISANPVVYYSACMGLTGLVFLRAGSALRRPASTDREAHTEISILNANRFLDPVLTLVIMVITFGVTFGWMLFVAPANYLVTLVSGAPAREYLRYPNKRLIGVDEKLPERKPIASIDTSGGETVYVYNTGTMESPGPLTEKEEKNEIKDLTFGRNPFGTTQTLTAIVVFVVGRLL